VTVTAPGSLRIYR